MSVDMTNTTRTVILTTSAAMATAWDDEGIWNAAFGAYETRESVLAEAERLDRTPQDYARNCVLDAQEQGADFDRDTAFQSLCRQLGVPVS